MFSFSTPTQNKTKKKKKKIKEEGSRRDLDFAFHKLAPRGESKSPQSTNDVKK
jgi:hypothetical protein